MSIITRIEDSLIWLSRYGLAREFPEYCDLETVIALTDDDRIRHPELTSPYIAVTARGEYMSTLEIAGALKEMREDVPPDQIPPGSPCTSLAHFAQHLTPALATFFRTPGHKISMVLERDPEGGEAEIRNMLAPQYSSLRRTGMQMEDILDEKIATLSPWLIRERCWLSVWSSHEATSRTEYTDYLKKKTQTETAMPHARYGQPLWEQMFSGLKIRHDALINTLIHALSADRKGQLVRLMETAEVCRELRSQILRGQVPRDWRPVLAGENRPAGWPQQDDISALLAPPLNFQLFSDDVETSGSLVRAGGLWHGTASIVLPPQQLQSMNDLIVRIPRSVPWRIRMDIAPGGMKKLQGKRFLASMGRFINSIRPLSDAIETLAETDRTTPVCVMTIVASTWAATKEDCRRNLMLLRSALEGWGICEVTTTFGDPRRGWVNSLLAASTSSGPNLLYPPLNEALWLAPFNRPASAWSDDAQVMGHVEDGKPVPLGLASSRQTKFTEIVGGEPGTGKSVLVNALSNAMVTSAMQKLPFLAVIDKGYSALGQIQLVRDNLPEDRKDEAVGIVLKNSDEYCRNPFDILFGARYPIPPEREFMLNLLYALCIDASKADAPNPADTRQILSRIIDAAFTQTAETAPRLYEYGTLPAVDRALAESGLREMHDAEWWSLCTWYDVRDILHDRGYQAEAQQAHYQAVPELTDMIGLLSTEAIRTTFGTVQRDGSQELLLSYIQRSLTSARSEYRMLAGRTRFALNPDTRLIAVDLNLVAGDATPAGRLKTGIMYLFAGQITSGDFILPQYQEEVKKTLAPAYWPAMQERIRQLDQEIKTKLYDELHNVRGIDFILQALETNDREMRKFGIRTVLCSQYLGDFPEAILKSANSLWLMKIRESDKELLRKHFGVPDVTLTRFSRHTGGAAPDGSGTSFLGVFRTRLGTMARILKNTLGPRELWALNSSPEDSALRRLLNEEVGTKTARRILAENFPHGSAARVIEYRRKQAGDREATSVTAGLATELLGKQGYRL